MPRVNTVKSARKDYPDYGIKKGDTYYWWKFRYGGKRMSKTYPKASQLTQSDFLSQMYDIADRISNLDASNFSEPSDLESERDDIVSELETLRDEQQEKRDNMPQQLQDSGSGELLQERYDNVDAMIDELNGVSLDDHDEDSQELEDWLNEKIGELQSCEYSGS